jgi:hypothetical protein
VPAYILSDIQGMGRAEAAREKAAPAYRRASGIQDFVKDTFDFPDISLNG